MGRWSRTILVAAFALAALAAPSVANASDPYENLLAPESACGREAFYRFNRVGLFRGSYGAGENLALTYGDNSTVRAAMELWLNSAEHRHVLLTRRYHDIGVSVLAGGFDGHGDATIWVAHFGYHH